MCSCPDIEVIDSRIVSSRENITAKLNTLPLAENITSNLPTLEQIKAEIESNVAPSLAQIKAVVDAANGNPVDGSAVV